MIMNSFESVTVVLPIQINKKEKDIWKKSSELESIIKNTSLPEYNWSIVYDGKKVGSVTLEDLFECDKDTFNMQSFRQGFSPEVEKTLYGYESGRIVRYVLKDSKNRIVMEDGEKSQLFFTKTNGKITISSNSSDEVLYYIRKICLAITVFGSCLLDIECCRKKCNESIIPIEDEYWDIEGICSVLGIKSDNKLMVSFPTKSHPYIAKLIWKNYYTGSKPKTVYRRMSISRTCPINEEYLNDIIDFFNKPYECFWIVILQKTVAIYISSLAGTKNVPKKNFNSVYEAFILFDNQYNYLEVSFDPRIQDDYRKLIKAMDTENIINKLRQQIDALHSVLADKKDMKRNIILAFFTIVSLVTGFMQVAYLFSQEAGIIVWTGIISLVFGLIFFIFYLK